jgi:hypothetical protein
VGRVRVNDVAGLGAGVLGTVSPTLFGAAATVGTLLTVQ